MGYRRLNVQMEAIKWYKIVVNLGYIGKPPSVIQLRMIFIYFWENEMPSWVEGSHKYLLRDREQDIRD